jgi:hypothetical protein
MSATSSNVVKQRSFSYTLQQIHIVVYSPFFPKEVYVITMLSVYGSLSTFEPVDQFSGDVV